MNTLLQDLRQAVRRLGKSPGTATVLILTLTLGLGATSAVFSVVNGILLRPLPYPDSGQLVKIWAHFSTIPQVGASEPEYLDYREGAKSFEYLAAYVDTQAQLTGTEDSERVRAVFGTAELLPALGVEPAVGRGYQEEDDVPGAAPVVVISHGLWQSRFGGQDDLVGSSLLINGISRTVTGIMPPGFDFPEDTHLWMPLAIDTANPASRGRHYLPLLAKLKPGVSVSEAQAEMDVLTTQIKEKHGYRDAAFGVDVISMLDEKVGTVRSPLLVMLVAVILVLLIVCANMANILLTQVQTRDREIAMRSVLGASRFRLLRQFFTDSLLYTVLGGGLGLLLAYGLIRTFLALQPGNVPRIEEVGLDGETFLFTLLIALVTGLIVSLMPAWKGSKPDLNQAIKSGDSRSTDLTGLRIRRALVIFEVAVALVLFLGAGLLIKSFFQLKQTDPQFQLERLQTMQLILSDSKYPPGPPMSNFYNSLMDRLAASPGLTSASLVSALPFSTSNSSSSVTVEGLVLEPEDPLPEPNLNIISPGYFNTMGIALLDGREFTDGDGWSATRVAIVNEFMAETLWPDQSPLGRRVKLGQIDSEDPWLTVVGVVATVPQTRLELEPRMELYFPFTQNFPRAAYIVTRYEDIDSATAASTIRAALKEQDSSLPAVNIVPMESRLDSQLAQPRFSMLLLSAFAGVAVFLAVIGIYGVISYSVAQRTREIGIRMALGAQRQDVLKGVIREGMIPVILGLGVGVVAALGLTHLISSLLFQVEPTDPATFVMVSLAIFTVALIATLLPAWRASKLQPVTALAYE